MKGNLFSRKIKKEFIVRSFDEGNLITEAFGIDAGYINKVVDVEIPCPLPQIVYITGESGCGKTTLIKELELKQNLTTLVEEHPHKPLFQFAENEFEGVKLLSLVGLGDATLFVAPYCQLSDSQKARAKLYCYLLGDNKTIYVDEFLSTLDRKTAKAVAFVFQKATRNLNKNLIVATAHDDLVDFLNPDLVIEGKAFPSRWKVIPRPCKKDNPFLELLSFEYKNKFWYKELALGELHYKGKYTGGCKEYLGCFLDNECIGVLVSTYRRHDGGRRISRVVIHPSYRGCGIGTELVKKYLCDFPGADTIAAMALFNPIFEKAGMREVSPIKITPPKTLKKRLKTLGFEEGRWYSKTYCRKFCEDEKVRDLLSEFAESAGHLVVPGGKRLTTEQISYKIKHELFTAGRVLWGFRPREMAKYVSEKLQGER